MGLENLQTFCRTCLNCLQTESTLEFAENYDIRETPDLTKLLIICTCWNTTEDSDEIYPQLLCKKCYKTLQQFNRFREMANKSCEILRGIVENTDGILIAEDAETVDSVQVEKRLDNDCKSETNSHNYLEASHMQLSDYFGSLQEDEVEYNALMLNKNYEEITIEAVDDDSVTICDYQADSADDISIEGEDTASTSRSATKRKLASNTSSVGQFPCIFNSCGAVFNTNNGLQTHWKECHNAEKGTHTRIKHFVKDIVTAYSEDEFKNNFHVTRECASYLWERYGRSNYYSVRKYKGGRPQNSAQTEMLAFLWFSSTKNNYRDVSNIFNMSISCFKATFSRVLDFLVEELSREVINFPTINKEKEKIASKFEKIFGFPNVLGCIDCTYILIRTPKHKVKSTFTNRNDCISITMQGICDSNLKFLDVYTGVPGKMHDSRIFKRSSIAEELPAICGETFYLLGDAAYPLREYLLTPYSDYGNLSKAEKKFNFKLYQTRATIENAFGMLKSRFRQLMRLDFHDIETMSKFVLSCCALHNVCIQRNEVWNFEKTLSDPDWHDIDLHEDRIENLETRLGEIKRDTVKKKICHGT